MRIGIISRADNIGLGVQTWEFFRHMNPAKTLVINSQPVNGNKNYFFRFNGGGMTKLAVCYPNRIVPKKESCLWLASGIDLFFTCETPYNYYMFPFCRKRGAKTVLQFNWEFLDYLCEPHQYKPDVLVSPSYWHLEEAQQRFGAKYLPVPINRKRLAFQRKTQFKKFLHLAGIGVDHDRNGTEQSIQAFMQVPDAHLTVRVQNDAKAKDWQLKYQSPNVTIESWNCENYWDNYTGFDALVLPRKYGGLCLPMQEALSTGMPVVMTDTSPNDKVLPKEWLCECEVTGTFLSRSYPLEIFTAKVSNLVEKINYLASMTPEQAGLESDKADAIAANLDWEIWKDKYFEFFRDN